VAHQRILAVAVVLALLLAGAGCLQGPENKPPRAVFETTRTSANAGDAIAFDATNSSDSDGTISTYHWDFGDGDEGFGPTASHVYGLWGTYNVTLTVTDDNGKKSIYKQSIVVNGLPVAVIDMTPRVQFVGAPVRFTAERSTDPDGRVSAYSWSFGDGNRSTSRTVEHAYAQVGRFQVTLRVWDDRGAESDQTEFVEVTYRSFSVNFTQERGALQTIRNYTFAGAMWADNLTLAEGDLFLVTFTLQWRDNIHPPGAGGNDMFTLTVSPPQGPALSINGTQENLTLMFPFARVPLNRTVEGSDATSVSKSVMEVEGSTLGKGMWFAQVDLVEAGGFRDDSGFIPDPGNLWELSVTYETYVISVTPAS